MDNRETILQAALDLFTARGYDAGGVQEICEAAGITKPTLYHYFGSKRGLLEALLAERHAALDRAAADAAAYQGDLPLTLERVGRAFFAFARAEPRYYRLLLALYFAPPESEAHQLMAQRFRAQHNAVEALFTAAVRDHGNMRGRERLFAASFLGLLNTCIGLYLNGYADLDDALLRQVVRQFQYGIYS
jgi:TetR/AcrR family transcriptional regulator